MDYEISATTVRILTRSREVAAHYGMRFVDTRCLLLSLLDESEVCTLLTSLHADLTSLRNELTQMLGRSFAVKQKTSVSWNPLLHKEKKQNDVSELPHLDVDTGRLMKLTLLEKRLNEKYADDATLFVLAILHDRENAARALLEESGIDYRKVLQHLRHTLPEEEDFDEGETDILSQKREGSDRPNSEIRKERKPKAGFNFTEEEDAPDEPGASSDSTPARGPQTQTKTPNSDTPVVDNFGTDLTQLARNGSLDPVVGREKEMKRMEQILCRRKKNNPILIGEPGVGKSAIVEGLAQQIVSRKVPRTLIGKRIVALDMASIVAGTQYRGQFEERLRRLIQELKEHAEIILFVDEIHTIIGAGSSPGSLDAANILKPALARGEVQCIGATTTGEFKKTIEKDGALDRRFQKLMLEPTSESESLEILRNIRGRYEHHHNVTYTDEALEACVKLTARYMTDRCLPDKAIDAMDEAGSRKHLGNSTVPKEIEEKEKEIEEMRKAKLDAARDQNYELAANLRDRVSQMSKELEQMTKAWQESRKDNPEIVDAEAVAEVVSMMSGVPVTRVAAGESERLKGMKAALMSQVIAQDSAVERLTRAITRSRIGLKGQDRPIGTFLFVGPTGVGKTHLVKCLAEWMFGSKDSLIRIDMSEYGEKYSVSRLLGAPPGYVGYEEGGQLTERVRRKPYSVILLDEIEKAHPDVFNTLLQVMDEGRLTDGNGVTVDFRNTIIILTSNSGTRQLREFGLGVGFNRSEQEIDEKHAESIVLKSLKKQFAPEFLNRVDDIIMFNPLSKESACKIAELEIRLLSERLEANDLSLEVTDSVRNLIVNQGFDSQYGARSLKRAIQRHIEDPLCDYMMEHPESRSFIADTDESGQVKIEGKDGVHQD